MSNWIVIRVLLWFERQTENESKVSSACRRYIFLHIQTWIWTLHWLNVKLDCHSILLRFDCQTENQSKVSSAWIWTSIWVNVKLDCHSILLWFDQQTENESKVSSACLSYIFTDTSVNLNVNLCECHTGLSLEFCCDLNGKPKMNLRWVQLVWATFLQMRAWIRTSIWVNVKLDCHSRSDVILMSNRKWI